MSRHVALLIEDDADTAAELVKLLRSIEHDCLHAPTIEDARRFLDGSAFCYMVVDQQMVAAPGDSAEVATGMAFLRHARRCYPGMNDQQERVVQILAMSAHLKTAGDGAKVVKYGANEFIEKPFGGDQFLRAVEEMLSNAGRMAHDERCAKATAGARTQATSSVVPVAAGARSLDITGEFEDGKTVILLDGTRVPLKGSSLFVLVRLVLERLRDRIAGSL